MLVLVQYWWWWWCFLSDWWLLLLHRRSLDLMTLFGDKAFHAPRPIMMLRGDLCPVANELALVDLSDLDLGPDMWWDGFHLFVPLALFGRLAYYLLRYHGRGFWWRWWRRLLGH
jgi:hypothetical protein